MGNDGKTSRGRKLLYGILGIVATLVVGFLAIVVFLAVRPRCEAIAREIVSGVFVVDGKPDFGYRFGVDVKNAGAEGNITVTAILSTSEGQYRRQQTLFYQASESKDLTFQFSEPTINATNVEAGVTCTPR